MDTTEIILLVIAIAFVVLVGFVISLIVNTNKTLAKVNVILDGLEEEPKNLLKNINYKLKCLDPIFNVASHLGQGLEFKASAFKEGMYWKSMKEKLDIGEEHDKSGVSEVVDCAMLGLNLWKKYKGK